jgi:hypothetical protein
MDQMRRELSLRLPAARQLEFTFDDALAGLESAPSSGRDGQALRA